jgi:hypothetical protein
MEGQVIAHELLVALLRAIFKSVLPVALVYI